MKVPDVMVNIDQLNDFKSRCRGFTLVELAMVLLIVGLLLLVVLRGGALIDQARLSDLEQIIGDLSSAARAFKSRYQYLPGDLVNANQDLNFPAAAPWAPPPGQCDVPPAATSGDGLINTAVEIECVLPHLFFAGYIESVEILPARPFMRIIKHTDAGILGIRVVATATSNFAAVASYPPAIQHIVELANLPLLMAQDLDRKLDDGNLNNGEVQGNAAPPVDPVAFLSVPLRL